MHLVVQPVCSLFHLSVNKGGSTHTGRVLTTQDTHTHPCTFGRMEIAIGYKNTGSHLRLTPGTRKLTDQIPTIDRQWPKGQHVSQFPTACKRSVAIATNKRGMLDRKIVFFKPMAQGPTYAHGTTAKARHVDLEFRKDHTSTLTHVHNTWPRGIGSNGMSSSLVGTSSKGAEHGIEVASFGIGCVVMGS